ncbi:MAG: fimbrial biogenesis outer membrane usher protein, partial [Rhizorhabdus sp.]
AGDLQPLGRGFQSLPEMAGLSLYRSYGVLQPQRIARPRGDRSFSLSRPSTIEVEVNGQVVRRVQLEPGNYDLRDFPFTQGSNDVRLLIVDDTGRSQVLGFNIFLDQAQLGRGLTEFGLYAGVLTASGRRGIRYGDDLAATGFVRHGFSDRLTLGANLQGDRRVQMGGGEALWSTPIGNLSLNASLSHDRYRGLGHAVVLTFQRVVTGGPLGGDSLNLFVERRSKDFAVLGTFLNQNPFAWEVGGGYARPLTPRLFAGVDGRYSRGRGLQPDVYNARASAGLRVSDRLSLTAEARYEKDDFARRFAGLLTATLRLGRYSNLRADFDTRFDRARLSYSTFRGQGVGAYNVVADLDRSDAGSGINVAANYFANRAELGFSHFGTFENTFGNSQAQRSSLRLASSVAFADGALSIGRPIYDSFAIVRGHRSLEGASIELERTPFGHIAETGALGSAVHPSLPAYIDRTITVDAPTAPGTADLGSGAYRVVAPDRGGYLLTVGSAYNVTAIGRLLTAEGEPVALASGTITELGQPTREPLTVFTNREGRFGAVGLAPGRWRIELGDEGKSTFVIDVPDDAKGILQVGELRPATTPTQDR